MKKSTSMQWHCQRGLRGGGGQVLQLIIDFEFIFKSEVKSVGHKNYSCVAFTLSINLPENAK